jgi:nucleoside-diphosphate-sugar epimerase
MTIIAVAGGAGKLGRAIVEAIVENGQHEVVILAREVSTLVVQNFEMHNLIRLLGQRCRSYPGHRRRLH